MEDREIIALYFARDERALIETAAKYGKLCFGVAERIVSNREDAEECVNDTYLGAWNAIPPTRPASLTAYLCRITRNLSLKRLERSGAVKRTAVIVPLEELEELLPAEHMACMEDGELGRLIDAFLRREKEDERKVFLRRYFFFDSVSEIAVRYSFSESKVKSMLCRTRERLREYLRKEGIEP